MAGTIPPHASTLAIAVLLLCITSPFRTVLCDNGTSGPSAESATVHICNGKETLKWTGGPHKSYTFQCHKGAVLKPEEQKVFRYSQETCTSNQEDLDKVVPGSILSPNKGKLRQTQNPASYTLTLGAAPDENQAFCYKCTPPETLFIGAGESDSQACTIVVTVPKKSTEPDTSSAPKHNNVIAGLSVSMVIASAVLPTVWGNE